MRVYKCYRVRAREPWYQLSKAEQDSLMEEVETARTQVGGKVVFACQSGWASEEWEFFGVEEFPDIEAVQKHRELLDELNWFRYIESDLLLGTEWTG